MASNSNNISLAQLAQYKAAKLEEANAKRKQLASQFPLLFSPQKSQKFQDDRIAPTTKFALTQLNTFSNKEVDDENLNWVQANISTPTSAKKKESNSELADAFKKRSAKKSKLSSNQEVLKPTATPTATLTVQTPKGKPKKDISANKASTTKPSAAKQTATSKTVVCSTKRTAANLEDIYNDSMIVNFDMKDIIKSPGELNTNSAIKIGQGNSTDGIEFSDIYNSSDIQDSVLVNDDIEELGKTPRLLKESKSTKSEFNDDCIQLRDIYCGSIVAEESLVVDKTVVPKSNLKKQAEPAKLASPDAIEFEEVYESSCSDSMIVNFIESDVAKTPYIPSLKELQNAAAYVEPFSLSELPNCSMLNESQHSIESVDYCEKDDADCNQEVVLRRSIVLSSLRAFISTMVSPQRNQVPESEIRKSEVENIPTPDLIGGKIHSRESLENYWESAVVQAESLSTSPMKCDAPNSEEAEIVSSTPRKSLVPILPPSIDQYSLEKSLKFTIASVTPELYYNHVKYAITCSFLMECTENCVGFVGQDAMTLRRFSDFWDLHRRVHSSLEANGLLDRVSIPPPPSKQTLPYICGRWKDESFLAYRARELFVYLKDVCILIDSLEAIEDEICSKAARGIRAGLWIFLFKKA